MSHPPILTDETVLALGYKSAVVPVLHTLRAMLRADALFLWEVLDESGRLCSPIGGIHEIHVDEKGRLCVAFYRFLEEHQRGFLGRLTESADLKADDMPRYLRGRYRILKYVVGVSRQESLGGADGISVPGFEPIAFGYGEGARPRKYVVLDSLMDPRLRAVLHPGANTEAAVAESVTAFHARTNTLGTYDKKSLLDDYKDLSIGLNHDRILVKRRGGGPSVDRCEHLCVMPVVLNGQVIALLKAEIYDAERRFSDEAIASVNRALPFLASFIVDSREGVQKLTYGALCKGEALLDILLSAQAEAKLNVNDPLLEVLNRLIHVFHVFHRGTFIGWSEISGRINHYIDEIGPVLELPETDLLARFERFRRYDELLLEDITQYREHFIHQFHTFALGLVVMLKVGVEQFRDWANAQLLARARISGEPYEALDRRGVIRVWFLISFYHDYAYILERFDEGMARFVRRILNLPSFTVSSNWSQLFLEDRSEEGRTRTRGRMFAGYLREMAGYLVSGESRHAGPPALHTDVAGFVHRMWLSVLGRQEHGPLSALVLLDSILRARMRGLGRVNEAYLAAVAIACHHEGVFARLGTVGGEPFITLEGFPFLFLIVYCDTAQEWGRVKLEEHASPRLESIMVGRGADEVREIRTSLLYDADEIGIIPTEETIRSIASGKEHSFKSRSFRFIIDYWKRGVGTGNAEASRITSIRFECVGEDGGGPRPEEKGDPHDRPDTQSDQVRPPEKRVQKTGRTAKGGEGNPRSHR